MDNAFIRHAIGLALESIASGTGGPFGAVVVRQGQIVGQGANQVTSTNDPTAHAEIVAIRQACRNLQTFQLADSVLYSSCEPCPMCLSAIYWARINRVVYAAGRADAAWASFDDEFIYSELSQPVAARRLSMTQLLQAEGRKVMETWRNTANRVPY
jgi:guanine deaminase